MCGLSLATHLDTGQPVASPQQMTTTHDKSDLLVRSMGGRGPPPADEREKTLAKDGKPYAVMLSWSSARAECMPTLSCGSGRRDARQVSSNGAYGKT